MVDVTLLEINLEGSEFTANAPFSTSDAKGAPGSKLSKLMGGSAGGESAAESADASAGEESSDESSEEFDYDVESEETPSPAGPIVALIALVLIALVVKKLRGGKSPDEADYDVED